jgi:hypothetical protein
MLRISGFERHLHLSRSREQRTDKGVIAEIAKPTSKMNLYRVDQLLSAYEKTTTPADREIFLEDFLQAMQKLPADAQTDLRQNIYLITLERIAKSNQVLKLCKIMNKK